MTTTRAIGMAKIARTYPKSVPTRLASFARLLQLPVGKAALAAAPEVTVPADEPALGRADLRCHGGLPKCHRPPL
jgi:hypothetical protein